MREDDTFTTPHTPQTMSDRDAIIALLDEHSTDDLRDLLAAVRIRQADAAADDDDTGGNHNAGDDDLADDPPQPLQDTADHNSDASAQSHDPAPGGLFSQVYAASTLLLAHTDLYADFDAVDPADADDYVRSLRDLELSQQPCFVVCTGGTAPRVVVLHGVAQHPRSLQTPSDHDGNTYAFPHDIGPRERASSVLFPSAWFEKTQVSAPTYTEFQRAKAVSPDAATVSYGTTSHTRSVSRACLLPTAFAPLLLNTDLSPTAAWMRLRAAAEADNRLSACKPLWDWLCSVGSTENADLRLSVLLPVAGAQVFREARARIQQAIIGPDTHARTTTHTPAPSPTRDPATAAIAELAKGFRSFATAPKTTTPTVETRWPYQVDAILRLCDCSKTSNLPPLWHALAKEKRGTPARICIQVACDAMAAKLGLAAPVITHHIANVVCDVAFVAHDRSDLLSGYSPFLFPSLSATDAQSLLNDIRVWDSHLATGSSATVADARQATQLARLAPLWSFVDVYAMLCRNEVLLAVLFGSRHHVVEDLRILRKYVFADFVAIERRMTADKTFGTLLLCAVRGNLAGFFRSAATANKQALYTQLAAMVDDLELGIWRPPALPAAFTSFFTPPPAQPPGPPPVGPQPGPAPGGRPGRQPRRSPTPGFTPQSRHDNPEPIPQWQMGQQPLKPCVEAARAAGVAIPVMDTGGNACLTWHFKGACYSNCRGAAAHRRPSTAEYRRLDSYNRRFCKGPTRPDPAPDQPPPRPQPLGNYVQPALPRDPAPPRWRTGGLRTQRRPATPPPPPPSAAPPPVPVIRTDTPDNASTLGPASGENG